MSASPSSNAATHAASGRRLTLVIPSLAGGGAERVICQLANHWSRQGHDVTLITLSAANTDRYELATNVGRVALDVMRHSTNLFAALWHNGVRLLRLRRAIRESRPQTVISFTDTMNVLTLIASVGLKTDVVVSERIDPGRENAGWSNRLSGGRHEIGRTWSRLRRAFYPRCRALVVQTQRVAQRLRSSVGDRPIHVIPNAAVPPAGRSPSQRETKREPGRHSIVCMGRLVPQKGFDLLIEAFAKIADRHPQWSVRILGDGPHRAELEQLAASRGLADRVDFAGWLSDPASTLQQADVFVLSSRYEGFPNALLEAMACGLPVVSFDCDSGPAEIVRDGVDGVLVRAEDVDSLAQAMDRLMSDESERNRLAVNAAEATERFSADRFFEQWDAVLTRNDVTPTG